MSKWKLQGVQPDTCDLPGCSYIELWDVEESPPRTMQIVAFKQVCPAHIANVPVGKILWEDGNWKDLDSYIQYQKDWFKFKNNEQWKIEHPDEKMPAIIVNFATEPITPGSISAPPQIEIDGMNTAYSQNQEHNLWKNVSLEAITDESIERKGITWAFTGVGDDRTLTVTASVLSIAQRNNVRSKVDIQFGPGKITINR